MPMMGGLFSLLLHLSLSLSACYLWKQMSEITVLSENYVVTCPYKARAAMVASTFFILLSQDHFILKSFC